MRKALTVLLILFGTALTADDSTPLAGWTATSAMAEARAYGCAARLDGNRVLVAGGTGANGDLASAEIYSSDGTFASAAPMNAARSHFTCTVLGDGRVLAAGGSLDGSLEVYDPVADSWLTVASGEARFGQAAVRLADGRVLLAGGVSGGTASATLEIYDPQAQALTHLDATLLQARQDHAANLLPDGTVLLIGGRNDAGPLGSVEIFDPIAGTVTAGPSLNIARCSHSATALDDGRVLVAGGYDGQNELDSAEMFDPDTKLWTVLPVHLNVARREQLAFRIPGNGGVLLAGGLNGGQPIADTEIYLPIEGTFAALGPLTKARTGLTGEAYDDGQVLAAGGNSSAGPVSACGLLTVPAVGFTSTPVHPQETAQAKGTGFPAGATVSFKLDLQGAVAGSTIASAQSRLLTTSVTLPPPSTKSQTIQNFAPLPIFNVQLADAGQTFRLTATAPGGLTATATVPAKVKITLLPTTPNPQFEGLNATLTVQLIRDGNPGPMTGTVTMTSSLWSLQTKNVNTTVNGLIVSFPVTNVPAGNLALQYSYSGDALHEPASASTTFLVVSRTPKLTFTSTTSTVVGSSYALGANIQVATPFTGAPTPTGAVAFFDGQTSLGTASPVSGTAGSSLYQLQITPLTTISMAVTIHYEGDSNYRPASTTVPVTVSVLRATPTLQFDSPPSTFVCGSPTTLTAELIFPPALGLFNRTVALHTTQSAAPVPIGNQAQGSLALSTLAAGHATATISTTLAKSTTGLQLIFGGDTLFNPVNSVTVPIAVQRVPVTVSLSATLNGGGADLGVSVNSTSPCGSPGPAGNVTFLEGSSILGVLPLPGVLPAATSDGTSNTIQLGENTVHLSVARPAGPHTFTVQYTGDQFHLPGTSAPVTVTFQ